MESNFELVYEGPADESEKTLRLIKGVFVAELEFPVSDVMLFLENAPICILKATDEKLLQKPFQLLKKAGAKVHLSESRPSEAAPDISRSRAVPPSETEPVSLETEHAIAPEQSNTPEACAGVEDPAAATITSGTSLAVADVEEDSSLTLEIVPLSPVPEGDVLKSGQSDGDAIDALELTFDTPAVSSATTGNVAPDAREEDNEPLELTFEPSAGPEIQAAAVELSLDGAETSQDSSKQLEPQAAGLDLPAPSLAGNEPVPSMQLSTPASLSLDSSALSLSLSEPDPESEEAPASAPEVTIDFSISTDREETAPALAPAKPAEPTGTIEKAVAVSPTPVVSAAGVTPHPIVTTSDVESVSNDMPEPAAAPLLERRAPLPEPRSSAAARSYAPRGLPILLLSLLFIAFNWFIIVPYFSESGRPVTVDLTEALRLGAQPTDALPAAPVDTFKFRLEETNGTLSIVVETEPFLDLPRSLNLAMSTAEPPPLTKEEIVRGLKVRDWLKRIELKNLILTLGREQKVQAVAFLRVDDAPVRVALPLLITPQLSKDQSELILTIKTENLREVPAGPTVQLVNGRERKMEVGVRLTVKKFLAE